MQLRSPKQLTRRVWAQRCTSIPGADHAFAQPLFNAGKTYDPVAADVAWRLSQDFLKRRLQ
jgi:dienelactone hydrolase